MSGAIINYELGKSTHREYEAQFSRYWGQEVVRNQEPISTTVRRLALELKGTLAGMLSAAGRLAF